MDDLAIEEFEQRVDGALRAPSVSDLEKLVSDPGSLTFLGRAGVETRYPRESEKNAKQRRKAEKEARKRLRA